jgi:type II secretory pathway pseudopilin PulG
MLKELNIFKSKVFKKTSSRAFSLVEVFVCIVLILIISSSILAAIISGNRIINRVSYRVMAMNYGREAVEELINRGYDGLNSTTGYIAYEYALPSGNFLDKLSGQRQYQVTLQTWGAEVTDYKEVTVRVTWTDPYSLQTKTEDYIFYLADRVTIL